MGNEWGEAYRNLFERKNAGKTEADLWEERRLAHWRLMRAARERYDELVAAHEAQGFNGANPFGRLSG